jgi:lysophospholipase L1-like esterase
VNTRLAALFGTGADARVRYADINAAGGLLQGSTVNEALFNEEGGLYIHPNEAGYEAIARELAKLVLN